MRHPCVSVRKGQPPRSLPLSLGTNKRENGLEKTPHSGSTSKHFRKHFIDKANYKQTLQALNSCTTKGKMVHYRSKISRTCLHDTTFIYKPKEATNPTKLGLLSLRSSLYMLYKAWTCQKTWTYISITSNILFRSLFVTFSPTYSFDVLVEAFVDTATPRFCWVFNLLLQLQCASWLPTALRYCFWVVEPLICHVASTRQWLWL